MRGLMPKKAKSTKSDAPPIEIPKVDDTYIQFQKNQTLERSNAALKAELDELRESMGQIKADRSDVLEHLQRELKDKNLSLAELQAALQETQEQLAATTSSKDDAMREVKEQTSKEAKKLSQQSKAFKDELHELKAFQEKKKELESELLDMRRSVSDLKLRHEQEVAELKREFDVKFAALRAQCDKKVEETEESVEARAMQRVDAVTKRTILLNERRLHEIENIHREYDDVQRSKEKLQKDNQALRFEVELKQKEARELAEKVSQLKGEKEKMAKALQEHGSAEHEWHQVSERGDKQTLVLQMMVRTLEDRVAKQAKQILHYQKRAESTGGHSTTHTTLPAVAPARTALSAQNTPREYGGTGSSILNFVNAPHPPKLNLNFPDPDPLKRGVPGPPSASALPGTHRSAPKMGTPRASGRTKTFNLKGDIEGRGSASAGVSRDQVTSLLLAATAPPEGAEKELIPPGAELVHAEKSQPPFRD